MPATSSAAPPLFEPAVWRQSRAVALQLVAAIIRGARGGQAASEASAPCHPPSSAAVSSPPSAAAVPFSPCAARPHLIVLDDNFPLRSMRRRCYQRCREQRVAFAQLYVECEMEAAIRNNERRTTLQRLAASSNSNIASEHSSLAAFEESDERRLQQLLNMRLSADPDDGDEAPDLIDTSATMESAVSEATIRKMAAMFEPPPLPSPDQHATGWERHSMRTRMLVDSAANATAPDSVAAHALAVAASLPWSFIAQLFTLGVPPEVESPAAQLARQEAARAATAASVLHALDLQTRKLLTQRLQLLQAQQQPQLSMVAQRWNQTRKQWLVEVKTEGSEAHRALQTILSKQLHDHPQLQEDEVISGADSNSVHDLAPLLQLFDAKLAVSE